jgi:hypothetical protein
MNIEAQAVATSVQPSTGDLISLFHRVWPPAGIVFGLIITVVWMGFLGYGFLELAFYGRGAFIH